MGASLSWCDDQVRGTFFLTIPGPPESVVRGNAVSFCVQHCCRKPSMAQRRWHHRLKSGVAC